MISAIELSEPFEVGNTIYFVSSGHHQQVLEWAHSPQGKSYLHAHLHTGKVARIWCPLDNNRVVKLITQNVGSFTSSEVDFVSS